MYDIIKHYKVLVLGLAFILWATLLAAAVLNLYNKIRENLIQKILKMLLQLFMKMQSL